MPEMRTRRTVRFDPESDSRAEELALHLGTTRSEIIRIGIDLCHAEATMFDLETDQAAFELGDRLGEMKDRIASRRDAVRVALRPPTSTLRQSMN